MYPAPIIMRSPFPSGLIKIISLRVFNIANNYFTPEATSIRAQDIGLISSIVHYNNVSPQ